MLYLNGDACSIARSPNPKRKMFIEKKQDIMEIWRTKSFDLNFFFYRVAYCANISRMGLRKSSMCVTIVGTDCLVHVYECECFSGNFFDLEPSIYVTRDHGKFKNVGLRFGFFFHNFFRCYPSFANMSSLNGNN